MSADESAVALIIVVEGRKGCNGEVYTESFARGEMRCTKCDLLVRMPMLVEAWESVEVLRPVLHKFELKEPDDE